MTAMIDESFNQRCNVTEDYGYGDAAPSTAAANNSTNSSENDETNKYGYETKESLGYGSSHGGGSEYGYGDDSTGGGGGGQPATRRHRPRRRGSVTKYSIEGQDTVKNEYDAHANVISQYRGGGDVAAPAPVVPPQVPTTTQDAPPPEIELDISDLETLVPLKGGDNNVNSDPTQKARKSGASKYLRKKKKKNSSDADSVSDGGSSFGDYSNPSLCSYDEGSNSNYGYGDGAPSSNKSEVDALGYGDAAPSSKADVDALGYGDAAPSSKIDVDALGYGDAASTSRNDLGYGDAAPTPRNDLGYGDAAPTSRNDLGYGDAAPTGGHQRDQSSESRRPRRRGSVTKYSIEAQNTVKEEYDAHSNVINQFRGGEMDHEETTMPLKDFSSSGKQTDDMSEDGMSGDDMSCDALSDDDMGGIIDGKKKKKKKQGRFGRFLGRGNSNATS